METKWTIRCMVQMEGIPPSKPILCVSLPLFGNGREREREMPWGVKHQGYEPIKTKYM